MVAEDPTFVLRIACPDETGLIHRITGVLCGAGLNIVANAEFVDQRTNRFYMRTEFATAAGAAPAPAALAARVAAVLPAGRRVELAPRRCHPLAVLATADSHCLGDLLLRCHAGDLDARIGAVISNRDGLADLAARFDVPFHCVPHAGLSREAHEARVLEALAPYDPELLVLAKYMRVLTPGFVARYPERIVNIHHSFLPAFAGARPYAQAFERGVKIIGATAHFVTEGLDAGPIIAQAVLPVDHTHGTADMALAGRDVEQVVLARALRLVLEGRVFVADNRTIIFA